MKPHFYIVLSIAAVMMQPAPLVAASSTVYAACTPTIRALTQPMRTGAHSGGTTVLGLSDPNQTMSLGAGTSLTGDVYLFNNASLSVAAGPVVIAGNIYLADHSSLHVVSGSVTVPNTDTVQYKWTALDDADIEITNSRMTVAATPGGIHRLILCGRAHGNVQSTDFSGVGISTEAVFVWETATLTLGSSQGSFEISADDAGEVNVANQHTAAPGHTLVYFAVHSTLPSPLTLAGDAGVTRSVQIPSDQVGQTMAAAITYDRPSTHTWPV